MAHSTVVRVRACASKGKFSAFLGAELGGIVPSLRVLRDKEIF
jgi:hypothetical protein